MSRMTTANFGAAVVRAEVVRNAVTRAVGVVVVAR